MTGPSHPRRSEAGLTLVEVMMVVFIIGLAASVAIMTLPPRESAAERGVREIRQALQDAHDRSVLTGEVIGLHPVEGGLKLVSWTGTEWLPAPRGDIRLPDDVRVELLAPEDRRGPRQDAPEQIVFNPLGPAEPVLLDVSWRTVSYRLTLLPDGDVVDATDG